MGQMYLQRFVYGEGVTKAALDQAWAEAFKAFAGEQGVRRQRRNPPPVVRHRMGVATR